MMLTQYHTLAQTSKYNVARDWPKVWTELPQLIQDIRLPTVGHNINEYIVSINRLYHMTAYSHLATHTIELGLIFMLRHSSFILCVIYMIYFI